MKTKFQDRMFGTNVVDTNWIRGKWPVFISKFLAIIVFAIFCIKTRGCCLYPLFEETNMLLSYSYLCSTCGVCEFGICNEL